MKKFQLLYGLGLAMFLGAVLNVVAGPSGYIVAMLIYTLSFFSKVEAKQAFFDIAGAIASRQSHSLISSYEIYDRDFKRRLGMKVPRASALSWMRAAPGRISKRLAKQKTYYYYEEGQWFKSAIKIGSVVNEDISAVASGSDVTITLHADNITTKGGKYYSYPVKNELIVFENETVGQIVAVSKPTGSATHKIQVTPVNSSQDIQASAVAGTSAVCYSDAQPEKSFETASRVPEVSKITNYMQTFREMFEVTDFEEQSEVEFEYNGQKYLYVKGTDETADRFEMKEELGLLITPLSENLTDSDGNTIQTTNALIPQISNHGKEMEYFQSPDLIDFDDTILELNQRYGDTEYVVGMGLNLNLKMKNFLLDFQKASPEVFFEEIGRDQSLKFNFKSIFVEPYKFHFQTWDIFTHADSLGAGNMPYKDMAVWIPTGKAKNPMPAHAQGIGSDYEPFIQVVYSNPGGSPQENKGDFKLFETGANARSGATDDEMTRKIHWVSYKGTEVRNRDKFLLWRKAK